MRLSAETVEALDGSRVVARHGRTVGKGVETLELDHYLETLQIKLGALSGATALHQAHAAGRSPPRTTASSSWRGAASVIATGRGR